MEIRKGSFRVLKVGTRYLEGIWREKYRARVERLGPAKEWKVGETHEASFVVGYKAGRFTLRLPTEEDRRALEAENRRQKVAEALERLRREAGRGTWSESLAEWLKGQGVEEEKLASLRRLYERRAKEERIADAFHGAGRWLFYIQENLRKGRWYAKGEKVVMEKIALLFQEGASERAERLQAELEALRKQYREGQEQPLSHVYLVPASPPYTCLHSEWFRLSERVPEAKWQTIAHLFHRADPDSEDAFSQSIADFCGAPGWYVHRREAPQVEEILGTAPERRIAQRAQEEKAERERAEREEATRKAAEKAREEEYLRERERLTGGAAPENLPTNTDFIALVGGAKPLLALQQGGPWPKILSLYPLPEGGFLEVEEVNMGDGWAIAAIRRYPPRRES